MSTAKRCDQAVSQTLRLRRIGMAAYQLSRDAEQDDGHGRIGMVVAPWHQGSYLDRAPFFARARALNVAHDIELLAIRQALAWLQQHPGWSLAILGISQFSLLYPGVFGQLRRLIDDCPLNNEQLCINIVTHEDCDFAPHLADCASQLRETGLQVMSNRFMDSPAQDARLQLDYFRVSRRWTRDLRADVSSEFALRAIESRASDINARLIIPHPRTNLAIGRLQQVLQERPLYRHDDAELAEAAEWPFLLRAQECRPGHD